MSNTKGWSLTARLVAKHFGAIGEKFATAIASFDPETATEADRDALAQQLRESATLLATAKADFNREHKDVVNLKELIARDEASLETLAERLEAGSITEQAVNLFCDEIEANKQRLSVEIAEEQQAKEYLDEVQQIVDALSESLQQFDAHAKKILRELQSAQAQKNLQEMKLAKQDQLQAFAGVKKSSTALDALAKKAQKISSEAEGLKTVAAINQKPIDDKAQLDSIRQSLAQGGSAPETALQRLNRLSAEKQAS